MDEDSWLIYDHLQAFENASTNIAAAQMRNALTTLAESVKDSEQKKASLAQERRPQWLQMILANASHSFSRRRWTTSLPSSVGT
jgi:hypothetical protein